MRGGALFITISETSRLGRIADLEAIAMGTGAKRPEKRRKTTHPRCRIAPGYARRAHPYARDTTPSLAHPFSKRLARQNHTVMGRHYTASAIADYCACYTFRINVLACLYQKEVSPPRDRLMPPALEYAYVFGQTITPGPRRMGRIGALRSACLCP
jgi:hypothetical protein